MKATPQRWAPLTLVETEEAVFVVSASDPEDWVACFQKRSHFPAHDWAERMVELHNTGTGQPLDTVGTLAQHAPAPQQR